MKQRVFIAVFPRLSQPLVFLFLVCLSFTSLLPTFWRIFFPTHFTPFLIFSSLFLHSLTSFVLPWHLTTREALWTNQSPGLHAGCIAGPIGGRLTFWPHLPCLPSLPPDVSPARLVALYLCFIVCVSFVALLFVNFYCSIPRGSRVRLFVLFFATSSFYIYIITSDTQNFTGFYFSAGDFGRYCVIVYCLLIREFLPLVTCMNPMCSLVCSLLYSGFVSSEGLRGRLLVCHLDNTILLLLTICHISDCVSFLYNYLYNYFWS